MSAMSGVKVLDLSRVLAGPWAGQLLADLGAEVIKVERPVFGDDTRHWGPPYMVSDRGETTEQSAYYLCTNRGKQSVCIDMTTEQGQWQLQQLAADSDVLIENFKVGAAARYGLDYPTLAKVNPRLVYCSITGFGQNGPYAERPGYDLLVQAMGGLMSITGAKFAANEDVMSSGPQKVGVALSDIMTGLYATIGIQAALAERERSGLGQQIDLALLDVTVATLANQASNYLVGGEVPQRLGNAHPNIVPYQSFVVADGHCVVAVGNDQQFSRFVGILGLPELALDDAYCDNRRRVLNRDRLIPILQRAMLARRRDQWLLLFDEGKVPAGPINAIDEVFDNPQVKAREMIVEMWHPDNAVLKLVANPLKFSRTPIHYRRPPPRLGEHTEAILSRLKYRKGHKK